MRDVAWQESGDEGGATLACYRYRTAALTGPWRRRPDTAMEDAVRSRQAKRNPDGEICWTVSGGIERSECRSGAPCRGIYPAE